MSLQHKIRASSQARPRYPTADPLAERGSEKEQQQKPSPGYVLEWNTCTSRRRNLSDVKELKAELLQQGRPGVGSLERLVVVSSRLDVSDDGVLEALRGAGGVDGAFLECHRDRKGYRGNGSRRGRAATGWWWCWEYPKLVERPAYASTLRHTGFKSFSRLSLWRGAHLSILLLLPDTHRHRGRINKPPPLTHQDAMTNASALRRHQSQYGTVDGDRLPGSAPLDSAQPEDVEMLIWDSLGDGVPLEEVLGAMVYEHWARLLEVLSLTPARGSTRLLDEVFRALEVNVDCARVLERQDRPLTSVSYKDWEDMMARAHRRLLLSAAATPSRPPSTTVIQVGDEEEEEADKEEQRSLDRISYLGGILLPVTVVSGVLSIEGDYGPEGTNFWVFWVASLIAAAVTILVIHVDRLRSLQVWIEVAADTVLEGGNLSDLSPFPPASDDEEEEEGMRKPSFVVNRRRNSGDNEGDVKAWRRKKLGWGGAVKKVSGYYHFRGEASGMQFHAPRDGGRRWRR